MLTNQPICIIIIYRINHGGILLTDDFNFHVLCEKPLTKKAREFIHSVLVTSKGLAINRNEILGVVILDHFFQMASDHMKDGVPIN